MTEPELDERAELMASVYGGWVDAAYAEGRIAYAITSWSDVLDMPVTVVQAWWVRN